MTRLALAGEPGFEVSLADAPKSSGEPNYTLTTLQTLLAEIGPEGALFCLMGADAFAGLKSWHGAAELPFVAPLIVASRPGLLAGGLREGLPKGLTLEVDENADADGPEGSLRIGQLRNAAGVSAPFYLLPGVHVDVSASEIRRQVQAARGDLTEGGELLPAAVAEYIRDHGLYC